jgi:pyruvate dehydrogenase E2 component (dihydrolipoamide acetyltransferase)
MREIRELRENMPYEFKLPALSEENDEGIVVAWFKREGSQVTAGENLLEVQLAKVSYDVPAPISGTLQKIFSPRDAVIKIGQVLALILHPGEIAETASVAQPSAPAQNASTESTAFVPASPAARRLARERNIDLAKVPGSGPEGRVSEEDVLKFIAAQASAPPPAPMIPEPPREIRASPIAKRLAQEFGIDLATIRASNADGRITEQDVRSALEQRAAAASVKKETLSPTRKIIARRMTESLQNTAQLTLVTEADVTELVATREDLKKEFAVTYTDLIVQAVARALAKHPMLNARLVGDELQTFQDCNVGIAVARDAGLIVPVLRGVNKKSLREISDESKALAERARSNALTEQDLSGGTFTVTNLGMFGIDAFTPILNPPEVAILGVGRIVERTTRKSKRGGVVWKQMLTLCLTIDHRAVDGAPGAAFLQTLCQELQTPK